MLQAFESAAFAAWPAQQSLDLLGWHLRLDRGYTKRANSANATAQSLPLTASDVQAIENHFRRSGLTPTFRLTSFAPIEDSDRLLDACGYRACDESLVMTRSLAGFVDGSEIAFAPDAAAWLDAFAHASGKRGADQAVHLEILRRITAPCAWAVHASDGPSPACGLGVLVGDQLGLFDVATHRDHQRRGLARMLCGGLLGWGARRGAQTAFLQVVAANSPAIRLYESLGFEIAYRYWYRVPTT
ncbi:GNAT family N-acetyltransferase [Ideonella sp.]|uniref:GNAT family N-acetyltransferase n=1 Tax=Ideonella sp. TaxID=1929293 RepID=UPI003BB751FC